MYRFSKFDGVACFKDLAYVLPRKARGVVFDVKRAHAGSFDYGALEGNTS